MLAGPQHTQEAPASSLNRGLDLFRQERYQDALTAFQQTVREKPDNAAVRNLIGITLTKLGRIPEANDEYSAAVRLNPVCLIPTRTCVNYWTLKLAPLAEQEFQAALKLAPEDEFAHYGLGLVYLAANRDAEALPHLERAGPALAQDVDALLGLTRIYYGANQAGKALQTVDAIERGPSLSPQQEYQLAVLLGTNGSADRALANFQNLARKFPDSPAAQSNLAIALMNVKEHKQAIGVLEPLQAKRPG